MKITDYIPIEKGVTCLIGGGGKTTLMMTLAGELAMKGKVIITTSTKIRRPAQLPVFSGNCLQEIRDCLSQNPVVCVGRPGSEGKLTSPGCSFEELARLADYVLVEADGSRGLPLKAHAPWEPVIPQGTGLVLYVMGLDGVGRPIREVCHRPELYGKLANAEEKDIVSPEMIARVIREEALGDLFFLNKMETEDTLILAKQLGNLLPGKVVAGSLHKGEYLCL